MAEILDLPEPLTRELREDAFREGVSLADHATLLLYIATALHDAGKPGTPFQQAIKTFLASRALDPDQIAFVIDELLVSCAKAPHESGRADDTLTQWRNITVHSPETFISASDNGYDVDPSQWPANFFNETYGSENEAQIERLSQGAYPERDLLE